MRLISYIFNALINSVIDTFSPCIQTITSKGWALSAKPQSPSKKLILTKLWESKPVQKYLSLPAARQTALELL